MGDHAEDELNYDQDRDFEEYVNWEDLFDGRDLAQRLAEDEPEPEEVYDCPIHGTAHGAVGECPRC